MPNYSYNPYAVVYPNQMPMQYQTQPMQQSFAPQPSFKPMEWVEGEIGAKAFQMPANWPANQPIPLWDSTDTNIFLKSWNQMGVPNPLQKLHYTIPNQATAMLPGESGATQPEQHPDMSQYVTKTDFENMRNEIREMLKTSQSGRNQNGSNGGNRGGNP